MSLQIRALLRLLPHYGAAFGLAVMLAGCASLTSSPAPETGTPVVRHYHDQIALAGRMSIRYTQNDQEQALHGSFTWDQGSNHIAMHLLSPLGQTLATIDIRPGIAVLQQSGKAPLSATDVDLLTEQALGWPLPVSGLREWLQGFGRTATGQAFIAQPSTEVRNYDSADGWKLSYGEWQDDGANTVQNHPKRLDLSRQTRQAGPVSIRIVIDKWQLPTVAGKS